MAKRKLTVIERIDEIPAFTSEHEEHAFWSTHELSGALWEQAEPLGTDELPSPRSSVRPVTLWLDESTLQRIKGLAKRQGKSQEALLTELLGIGLAEEERNIS